MSVITVSKPDEEFSNLLGRRPDVPAVVLGCGKCAKLRHTGGSEGVRLPRQRLSVSGVRIAKVPCPGVKGNWPASSAAIFPGITLACILSRGLESLVALPLGMVLVEYGSLPGWALMSVGLVVCGAGTILSN